MSLVLGLDPDINKIPTVYKTSSNHVDLITWGEDIILSCTDVIEGVKFQMAYFEAYGIMGYQALIELIGFSRWIGIASVFAVIGLIANTILIAVRSKISEHAILKTIGYTQLSISWHMLLSCLMAYFVS